MKWSSGLENNDEPEMNYLFYAYIITEYIKDTINS